MRGLYGVLPQPIAILIPTAIRLHPDFGQKMVKQKAPVPFKIPKGLIVVVGFVTFGKRLTQCHGVGPFTSHTNMIKVNRVVKFVLLRNYHNGIARNFLLNSNIDAEEKKDDNRTKEYDRYYLVFPFHPLSFQH